MKYLPDSAFIIAALLSIISLLMKNEIAEILTAACSFVWVILGILALFKK